MEMNLENLSKQELLKLIKDTEKELQKKDKLIEKHESLITRKEFEAETYLLTIDQKNQKISEKN